LARARPATTALVSATFELGNRAQDVELQPSRWRRDVDALSKGDERNPQRLQFVQQQNEVPKVAPEAVESPADQHIESPPTSGLQQFVQRRSAVLRTRHTLVNVFNNGPALGAPHTSKAP
jgi:hypothetical protein